MTNIVYEYVGCDGMVFASIASDVAIDALKGVSKAFVANKKSHKAQKQS